MYATAIIPTAGSSFLRSAIDSVLSQSRPTLCYVVCDGEEYLDRVKLITATYTGNEAFRLCCLPINVGKKGFYGHRIYAAFTHLINTEFVFYLDQDNWVDKNHVEKCINKLRSTRSDWCYALRKIFNKEGRYLCNDDCESLGKWQTFQGVNHIDTNAFFIPTKVAIKGASIWHGGWGQDRIFFEWLAKNYRNYECTGQYTLNYRLGGNPDSVNKEFFDHGNGIMSIKYKGSFPWRSDI
jgi:hypothetical protein